jgi:hypothetical protein
MPEISLETAQILRLLDAMEEQQTQAKVRYQAEIDQIGEVISTLQASLTRASATYDPRVDPPGKLGELPPPQRPPELAQALVAEPLAGQRPLRPGLPVGTLTELGDIGPLAPLVDPTLEADVAQLSGDPLPQVQPRPGRR